MELKEAQHLRESQLKAREEQLGKADYNNQAKCYGGIGAAVEQSDSYATKGCDRVVTPQRPPLLFELLFKAEKSGIENARNQHALEILQRHPEFEELIELLRLVPIF